MKPKFSGKFIILRVYKATAKVIDVYNSKIKVVNFDRLKKIVSAKPKNFEKIMRKFPEEKNESVNSEESPAYEQLEDESGLGDSPSPRMANQNKARKSKEPIVQAEKSQSETNEVDSRTIDYHLDSSTEEEEAWVNQKRKYQKKSYSSHQMKRRSSNLN